VPTHSGPGEQAEIVMRLARYLADEDYRWRAGVRLLLRLPELVAAGRYLDAWLVDYSARQLLEGQGRGGYFLAEMVLRGLRDWEEQDRSQESTEAESQASS
jgi:hypothetical protein